jgi:predicted metalloenzyme YecM
MDDVLNNLQQFQTSLETFNDRLRSSFEDLNKNHESVNPHWQDSMRKDYDTHWVNLSERMKQYVNVDGINYTEILLHKLNGLRKYLYGN